MVITKYSYSSLLSYMCMKCCEPENPTCCQREMEKNIQIKVWIESLCLVQSPKLGHRVYIVPFQSHCGCSMRWWPGSKLLSYNASCRISSILMTVVTELFAIKDKLWFWSYYGLHGPCSCKWWYIHDFVSATSRYWWVFSLFIILVWVLLRHLLKKFQPDLKNIITSQHVLHKLHFGAHRHLPTKRNAWEFGWPDLV